MISYNRLPRGATVLVTGASGFVGSSIAQELLEAGFKVRGAGREPSKFKLLQEKFDRIYAKGQFEPVKISDYESEEQLQAAVKGVDGVVHTATSTAMSNLNHDEEVAQVVEATLGIMRVAAREKSVKSFVQTSSRIAAFNYAGEKVVVTSSADAWLDEIVTMSKAAPNDHPMKPLLVYASTKVEAEKAAWKFIKEGKPEYTFNTVLPDLVMGKVVNPAPGHYTTNTWLNELFNGVPYNEEESSMFKFGAAPSLFVDVLDVARAHVIALTADNVQQERIFAMTDTFVIKDITQAILKIHPHHRLPDISAAPTTHSDITVPNQRFKDLLKQYYGLDPISLEESVARNILDA